MSAVANVFLIGAAKAGTTALADMLAQHARIAGMPIKEPGHFCTDLRPEVFSKDYNRLIQWDEADYFSDAELAERHIGFVEERSNYHRLCQQAQAAKPEATHILDASTAYLYSVPAAKELAHYNSKAKIIVLLRNPIDRAWSHFSMALKYGMESEAPLEAFKREAALEKARWGRDECYLELGYYAQQLKRWKEKFGDKHLLVVFHEDLKNTPQKVLNHITDFLDLPTFVATKANVANEGSVPKYPKMNALGMRVVAPIREKLPKEMVSAMKKVLQAKAPDLDEDVARWLKQHYNEEMAELATLLNLNLTHWK